MTATPPFAKPAHATSANATRGIERVQAAFNAARDYDGQARVQRQVAADLAARIIALPLPARPRVLEIGCGTGFLTRAVLASDLTPALWLATDLAPAMVERCRLGTPARPHLGFATLDGEQGTMPAQAPFDLICASLAFQWFTDLPTAIARLYGWLAPGGHLIFTTLIAGTFAEWAEAHHAEGLEPGTPAFLPLPALAALHPHWQAAPPVAEDQVERHGHARDFLRALKAIGAGTARPDHQPLPPAALRRVMARFDAMGAAATYRVATCHFWREP